MDAERLTIEVTVEAEEMGLDGDRLVPDGGSCPDAGRGDPQPAVFVRPSARHLDGRRAAALGLADRPDDEVPCDLDQRMERPGDPRVRPEDVEVVRQPGVAEPLVGRQPVRLPVLGEVEPVAEAQPLATLREHSAQLIRETLDQHGGNVSQAARALGISRGTLYRRLRGGRDEGF